MLLYAVAYEMQNLQALVGLRLPMARSMAMLTTRILSCGTLVGEKKNAKMAVWVGSSANHTEL
jgi:hypothetical protein